MVDAEKSMNGKKIMKRRLSGTAKQVAETNAKTAPLAPSDGEKFLVESRNKWLEREEAAPPNI